MNEKFTLTMLDRQILNELQADCRLSNQEIAERIGSSASSIWRRVRAMEEAGVVQGFHLSVAADMLGLAETMLLHVSLDTHSEQSTDSFTRLINESPEVLGNVMPSPVSTTINSKCWQRICARTINFWKKN